MEVLNNHQQYFDLIPNEMIIKTFIFIDAATLLNCRLVCKRWQELIDAYVFQEKAARENKYVNNGRGYHSFSQIASNDVKKLELPWYVFYVIIKYDPFNRNLTKNHCGQERWKHWRYHKNLSSALNNEPDVTNLSNIVEVPKNEHILNDPDFDGHTSCFIIDYQYISTLYQQITFKDYGLNDIIMKILRPKISFSAWFYKTYCENNNAYKLHATFHSKTNEVIGKCEHSDESPQRATEWTKASILYNTQGDESFLNLHHSLMDIKCQNILSGIYVSCSVVKMLLPIKYKNTNS
ncbi:F-box only protein 6-like [Melanaphis sacchari]|uniref:F-box only protein 6-like n=1 Tax=Melanaphis sacchari TaxID=742174 RepID=UPI000DC14727|nr:F-box only protein 6-like [Melanaphis sacchari]